MQSKERNPVQNQTKHEIWLFNSYKEIKSSQCKGPKVARVFDLLAPHRCEFKSRQGIWILSCEQAIWLAYETSMVLLRGSLVPEIKYGGAPDVLLHQYSWEVAI